MELNDAVQLVGDDEDVADGAAADPAAHVWSVRKEIDHAEIDYWATLDVGKQAAAMAAELLTAYRVVIDASDDQVTAALAQLPTG